MVEYPRWAYYPPRDQPPPRVAAPVGVVAAAQAEIDSEKVAGLTNDKVLAQLRPGLEGIGYASRHARPSPIRSPCRCFSGSRASPVWGTTSTVYTTTWASFLKSRRGWARRNAVYATSSVPRCSLTHGTSRSE